MIAAMKFRDAMEWGIALLVMVPVTLAVFLFLFGNLVASLLGFGAPVE